MKRVKLASTILILIAICSIIFSLDIEDCDGGCYAIKFFIAGIVFVIGSIYFTLVFKKNEKIIFNIESLPLMSTCDATEGVPFAGEGTVEAVGDMILKSPYTKQPCLYFHSIKEKLVRRGKRTLWEVIENLSLFVPFYFKDKNGKIKIDLASIDKDLSGHKLPEHTPSFQNSEIDCLTVLKKSSYERKSTGIIGSLRKSNFRITEYVLMPGQDVFVHGVPIKKDGELTLHEKGHNLPLIVSTRKRDRYVEDFYQGSSLIYFSYLLVAGGYLVSLYSLYYLMEFGKDVLGLASLIGCLMIMFAAFSSMYNRIITLRERANNTLSNIKIELKRRTNLIPNLVEVVKQYSSHEKEIQEILAKTRMGLSFSSELKEQKQELAPEYFAVIEKYPEIKAIKNFIYLHKKLVETENRIACSREFYNKTVRKYNTLIKQFPFLIVAQIFGAKEMNFIVIEGKERNSTEILL